VASVSYRTWNPYSAFQSVDRFVYCARTMLVTSREMAQIVVPVPQGATAFES